MASFHADSVSLNHLFYEARSHIAWDENRRVDDELIQKIYDAAKWGPTSMNGSPARFVFVKSPPGKERLLGCLAAGNVEKTKAAPVTVIVAYDTDFFLKLDELMPAIPNAAGYFSGNATLAQETAFRNGSMQAAYLIMAARAFGLDCGAMSGFDNAKCDELFFQGKTWKSNLLINMGYGVPSKLYPRGPRLDFTDACVLL